MRPSKLQSRQQLEALEQRVYLVVKKVIDKADPDSLLKLGCPKDEYDTLSNIIARAIVREGMGGMNRTGLAYIVALAHHAEFGLWRDPVRLHGQHFDIADKLLPLLPKTKR